MFSQWRSSEVAVLGLGRSGQAATLLLRDHSVPVYASDSGSSSSEAVAQLKASGAEVDTGFHDLARVSGAAAVVVSPGIPPSAEALVAARAAGVEVLSEVELALRVLGERSTVVMVTGTNGKTTTTSMIGSLMAASGRSVAVAGNIGLPLAEVARGEPPEVIVAEISSFQLHDTPGLKPSVGVVTNLSPDHLDRYPTLAAYYADKELLFRNADDTSRWILNLDDDAVMALAEGHPGLRSYFSVSREADGWYHRDRGTLMLGGQPLLAREKLRLLGDHNVANALAAALAAIAAGVTSRDIARGLEEFDPLPHRLEPVGTVGGVLWINDSKATNVASTAVALQALETPFVLLLGGRHKGEPYTGLASSLDGCRAVVAYGEAAETIAADLGRTVPLQLADSFSDAVAQARGLAQPGDAVLLSPACSSFDMFANYQERGEAFRREALAS